VSNPFRTDPHPDLTAAIRGVVQESHTRAQLEKLSITKLRELLKRYTEQPGSGRELADIRGLLRAKGAGSVLDEARKGLGKTQYGKALEKMGKAVDEYKKTPKPKPPVNPFKAVDESAPTTAAGWEAANRPSRETAKALQRGMKKFLSKYGKPKPAKPAAAPVREGATPCEKGALGAGSVLDESHTRAQPEGAEQLDEVVVPVGALMLLPVWIKKAIVVALVGGTALSYVLDKLHGLKLAMLDKETREQTLVVHEWAKRKAERHGIKAAKAALLKGHKSSKGKKPQSKGAKPVSEGASPCEKAAMKRLRDANAADLKEYPGKKGEAAHARLHKTIGKILKK